MTYAISYAPQLNSNSVTHNDFMRLMTHPTITLANVDAELSGIELTEPEGPLSEHAFEDQAASYSSLRDKGDELAGIVQEARAAYSMAKENASCAAAHTYMLWLKTTASSDAASWFDEHCKARNAEIAEMNKTLKANGLPGDTRYGLAAGEKWVKIAAREGTSTFTLMVKFALDFIHPKQATNVSRYVLVVEWLHNKFEQIVVTDAAELVKAITDAGGFETVVRMRRVEKSLGITKTPAKSKAAPTDKYEVLKQAKCLRKFSFDAKHSQKGFVVLIGRLVKGQAEMIGELKLTEAELNKAVGNLDEIDFQRPTDTQAAA